METPIELTDENCSNSKIKKMVLKFLMKFHPDKNQAKGRKIQVLYEEISKFLTRYNEVYK